MSNINEEYIDEYIRNLVPDRNELLTELEKYADENHVPIIEPEVGQFIKTIIRTKRPKRVLELGTAIGYSGIHILESSDSIEQLVTMEIREDIANIALENFKKANLEDKVELMVGDACELLPTVDSKFDLIFIDAAKGQYNLFFKEAQRLLNDDGIIICDNILFRGMVATDELVIRRKKTIVKRLRTFLKDIMETEGYTSSILPIGDGIAIILKG
ncbi:MAG: O-methyltransferase [Tissierellia bacterium]|nr:O-methyltransferase [Tissierellia bacterium]